MKITKLDIPEVMLLEPDVFTDYRGYYMESYSKRTLAEFGINDIFVQDNHLLSLKKGTIRGIHFQNVPYAQSKLLRCTKGKILDVVVDLRKNSPTYKKWVSVELDADTKKQIYIPKGFGHACLSLVDDTEVQYKVDELYMPEYDRAIAYNDPELNIRWGFDNIIVSQKDMNAPTLAESDVNFTIKNTKKKKVIVTGAGGFIGGALSKKLLQQGTTVYGIDINEEKLNDLKQYENFVPIIADFSKYDRLVELVNEKDFDVFYHFAWQGVFGDAFKDYSMQLSNAKYACDAITSSILLNCKRFVMAGTYNEFEIKNFINSETFTPRYTCIYSTAKISAELICKTLAYNNGIEYCGGLICMAYGEENYSKMLANVVINQLNNSISPKLIEGNNYYDMIYIDDIVDAFLAIGEKGVNMKSYYIGHRNLKTFREIITEIRDILNPQVQLLFGEFKDTADMDYSLIDLDALYNDTSFECKADFKESILKTAEWVKTLNWEA